MANQNSGTFGLRKMALAATAALPFALPAVSQARNNLAPQQFPAMHTMGAYTGNAGNDQSAARRAGSGLSQTFLKTTDFVGYEMGSGRTLGIRSEGDKKILIDGEGRPTRANGDAVFHELGGAANGRPSDSIAHMRGLLDQRLQFNTDANGVITGFVSHGAAPRDEVGPRVDVKPRPQYQFAGHTVNGSYDTRRVTDIHGNSYNFDQPTSSSFTTSQLDKALCSGQCGTDVFQNLKTGTTDNVKFQLANGLTFTANVTKSANGKISISGPASQAIKAQLQGNATQIDKPGDKGITIPSGDLNLNFANDATGSGRILATPADGAFHPEILTAASNANGEQQVYGLVKNNGNGTFTIVGTKSTSTDTIKQLTNYGSCTCESTGTYQGHPYKIEHRHEHDKYNIITPHEFKTREQLNIFVRAVARASNTAGLPEIVFGSNVINDSFIGGQMLVNGRSVTEMFPPPAPPAAQPPKPGKPGIVSQVKCACVDFCDKTIAAITGIGTDIKAYFADLSKVIQANTDATKGAGDQAHKDADRAHQDALNQLNATQDGTFWTKVFSAIGLAVLGGLVLNLFKRNGPGGPTLGAPNRVPPTGPNGPRRDGGLGAAKTAQTALLVGGLAAATLPANAALPNANVVLERGFEPQTSGESITVAAPAVTTGKPFFRAQPAPTRLIAEAVDAPKAVAPQATIVSQSAKAAAEVAPVPGITRAFQAAQAELSQWKKNQTGSSFGVRAAFGNLADAAVDAFQNGDHRSATQAAAWLLTRSEVVGLSARKHNDMVALLDLIKEGDAASIRGKATSTIMGMRAAGDARYDYI